MRTLLANVLLLGALLAAPIVHADAATANNTGPGCDAREPSCAIWGTIDEALRNSNPTDDLTVNRQGARRGCANFGGGWERHQSGGIRCDVAPQVNQPFSLHGTADVEQHGCRFSYPDFNGRQKGKIRGGKITIPKPVVHPAFLNLFSTKSVKGEGHGRVQSGVRARVKISSRVKGEIHGIRTTCVIKSTTDFLRTSTTPVPPGSPPINPLSVGFEDTTVSVDYHFPSFGSIFLRGSSIDVVDVGHHGTTARLLLPQDILIEIEGRRLRVEYLGGWHFATGPKTYDGPVVSVTGTTKQITGISSVQTQNPGYNGSQVTFDSSHVYINQLGFVDFQPFGSITVFVNFAP